MDLSDATVTSAGVDANARVVCRHDDANVVIVFVPRNSAWGRMAYMSINQLVGE